MSAKAAPLHALYENSVQESEGLLDFIAGVYRRSRGRQPHRFREDFCGTALLSATWVQRSRNHYAWGIDVDEAILEWSREHHLSCLGKAEDRISLLCGDVMTTRTPQVDIVGAFNFSFNVFKERETLLHYFSTVRETLNDGGILFLDEFGGPESHSKIIDKRHISGATMPDGTPLQSFTYIWDQCEYNPLSHEIRCHIHFHFKDGTKLRKAFTYDWRLWTVPELKDLLREAGFARSEIYLQGWDEKANEANGIFRKKTRIKDAWDSWFAYLAAYK